MKIEKEVIHFKPGFQFGSLSLSDLQKQYLSILSQNSSIESTVDFFLKQGWLVSFVELYNLIHQLVSAQAIANPNFYTYFKEKEGIQVSNFTSIDAKKNAIATNTQQLQNIPFFRSLDPRLSELLLKNSYTTRYPARSYICKAGEAGRDLYLILNGQAGIYRPTSQGHQLVSSVTNGALLGEAGFFLGTPRSAHIITMKETDVVVIPHSADFMNKFVDKNKAQALQVRFWIQQALQTSPFFKTIPPDCLDALAFAGPVVKAGLNQVLFREGEAGHSAYVVIQGSLVASQNGKSIRVLAQGSFFGEIALLVSQGRRTATIHTQQESLLLEVRQNEFYRLLSQNIFLAKEIEELAHKRIHNDRQRQAG